MGHPEQALHKLCGPSWGVDIPYFAHGLQHSNAPLSCRQPWQAAAEDGCSLPAQVVGQQGLVKLPLLEHGVPYNVIHGVCHYVDKALRIASKSAVRSSRREDPADIFLLHAMYVKPLHCIRGWACSLGHQQKEC